ncbi:hypothetical protein HanXRQr2_Chr17g0790171 [Helianthus annuus]|uniref:Uncharacterized protein n=1 Tax=Helianthus annuus TaxID=4232 RepID=A0A9K3DFC9_HELAN|nr:hypothetical protein HanXRQr2_Chr17g0790171 [Helianthus annuus]
MYGVSLSGVDEDLAIGSSHGDGSVRFDEDVDEDEGVNCQGFCFVCWL